MKALVAKRRMDWVAAIILAVVFAAAALPKIANPADFALAIYRYQLPGAGLINPLAILLPWVELAVAGAILIPRLRPGASLLLLLMLAGFTAGIVSALHRGLDIACGCFTVNPEAKHAGLLSIVRNILLLACAAWLAIRSMSRKSG